MSDITDAGPRLRQMNDALAEIERLREAIRRLAEQDATLSVCDGNVTVTMDATLTEAERAALRTVIGGFGMWVAQNGLADDESLRLAVVTLRSLLERTNPRLAALQKLTELDEELGLPRTPPTHSN